MLGQNQRVRLGQNLPVKMPKNGPEPVLAYDLIGAHDFFIMPNNAQLYSIFSKNPGHEFVPKCSLLSIKCRLKMVYFCRSGLLPPKKACISAISGFF